MKKLFKTSAILAIVAPMLFSCSKSDNDYAEYGAYVTVAVTPVLTPFASEEYAPEYYFLSDDGEKVHPGDVSRIGKYKTADDEGVSKDGKRAFIYFNYMPKGIEGYDYNVSLYQVVDILSKEVELADTQEKIDAAGDDPLTVNKAVISGEWLDIQFSLNSANDLKHVMTLLDNQVSEAPESLPEGYQYLEFRQNAGAVKGNYLATGYVSYKLKDAYNPAITGKKGFYIRVNTIDSGVQYIKVNYTAIAHNVLRTTSRIVTNELSAR